MIFQITRMSVKITRMIVQITSRVPKSHTGCQHHTHENHTIRNFLVILV
jgi:hypothetical protein